MNFRLVGVLLSVPVAASLIPSSVSAQEAIFQRSLHLEKTVEDPISSSTATVDEYYLGNQMITVSGDRVSIADYADGTLTEIDHAAGTWSRTTFAKLASVSENLTPSTSRVGAGAAARERRFEARAARGVAGRTASVWRTRFEEDHPEGLRSVEVAVDPSIRISDRAAEIMSGSAFPARPSDIGRATINATTSGAGTPAKRSDDMQINSINDEGHALPIEQIVTWEIDGEEIQLKSRVTRIDEELIDPALLALPENGVEIENHLVKMQRLLEELDQLPGVERQ